MIWFVAFAFAGGCLIAMQPPINAELARHLGTPFNAALFSFIGGTLVLLAVHGVMRSAPDVGSALRQAPWWSWVGGVLGAAFVTTSIFLLPRIGAAAFTVGMVTGQLASAMIIDHFGLLGTDRRPATPGRLVGIGLMVIGVALVAVTTRSAERSAASGEPEPRSERADQ